MDCRFCRPLSIIIIPFNWAFVKLWVVASLRLFPDRYLECSFSVLLVKCRAPTSVASWARQRIDLLVKAEGVQGDSDWRATQSVCIAYPWWLRWWSVCPQCARSRFHPWVGRSLEKEMATHSSTLAWKIPWTEEPGRLQAMGSQRVEHDWATSLFFLSVCTGLYPMGYRFWGLGHPQNTWSQDDSLGELFDPHREFQ